MSWFEFLSLILGAIAVLFTFFGGCWAVISLFFKLKGKVQDQAVAETNASVKRLEVILGTLGQNLSDFKNYVQKEFERQRAHVDNRIELFLKKTHEMELQIVTSSNEIKSTRDAMEIQFKHMSKVVDGIQTEKVQVGRDAWLVRNKKPSGDDGK